MIERIKKLCMKKFKLATEYELFVLVAKVAFLFYIFFAGICFILQSLYFHNLYLAVVGYDIIGLVLLYVFGWWAVEKEMEDTWNGEKTMEMGEADKRRKVWEKNHPILNFFQSCYYEIARKKDIPENSYYNIKYFIQRGKRGYSYRDVWSFYYYLTNVIIGGLKELQKNVHGFPGDLGNSKAIDFDGESKGTKKWKEIIGKIIWTFEAIKKIEKYEWLLVEDESKRREYKNYIRRLNKPDRKQLFDDLPPHKWHLMTKKEMKKYHEGWANLKKYFLYLWD